MSVASRNPFALLDGEPPLSPIHLQDLLQSSTCIYADQPNLQQLTNVLCVFSDDASRPASPAPAAAEKQAAPTSTPARGTGKTRGGPASRGGRYYQRGGKAAPRDKENAEVAADDSEPKKRGKFFCRTVENAP